MHGIGSIGIHTASFASQGTGMNNPSGTGFNLAALTSGAGHPMARGVSPTGTGSLGSQTVSTLLQTQDLSQQVRGGGHGGGGHHGMKMMAGLETEEVEEAEETASPHQTKRTGKAGLSSDTAVVAESDEEGDVTPEAKDQPQSATSKDLRTSR